VLYCLEQINDDDDDDIVCIHIAFFAVWEYTDSKSPCLMEWRRTEVDWRVYVYVSRGYAFIEFDTKEAADGAAQAMNLFDLGGQPLRVGRVAIVLTDVLLESIK